MLIQIDAGHWFLESRERACRRLFLQDLDLPVAFFVAMTSLIAQLSLSHVYLEIEGTPAGAIIKVDTRSPTSSQLTDSS